MSHGRFRRAPADRAVRRARRADRPEEVDPAEAITPARVREIHRELLTSLDAERGDRWWALGNA